MSYSGVPAVRVETTVASSWFLFWFGVAVVGILARFSQTFRILYFFFLATASVAQDLCSLYPLLMMVWLLSPKFFGIV